MSTLYRKLLRNLWQLRGQGLAIAAVIAGGVAMLIMSYTVFDALILTQKSFYQQQHFADLFADIKRAPNGLLTRLAEIPGILVIEDRIKAPINVRLPGFDEPISGLAISLPEGRQPQLNQVHIKAGRLPEALAVDQTAVSEAFADAHHLGVGDHLNIVINGVKQRFVISGIVLSPEFIFQIQPGAMIPDYQRYCILWVNRSVLETAFDMTGAFNSLSVLLSQTAQHKDVIDQLDVRLKRWGGLGAFDRDLQTSHVFLKQELQQLHVMATIMPAIFIAIAAFLLNMVASRLIATQREQIAILKAFGYANLAIAWHYTLLVLVIALVGTAMGVAGGLYLAQGLGGIYQEYYRFPWLTIQLQPLLLLKAVVITSVAAVLGALRAILAAMRLPPAEAMRPEPPALYRKTTLERLGLHQVSQSVRMVLRNIERKPVKAALSVLGLAMSVAILMVSGFQKDAIDHMIYMQFHRAEQQTATVQFFQSVAKRSEFELAALPGVYRVEAFRQTPVVLRNRQFSHRLALQGVSNSGVLTQVLDRSQRPIPIRDGGLYLSTHLADKLRLSVGENVDVTFLDGARQSLSLPVVGTVEDYVGVHAYMSNNSLARVMTEQQAIEGAYIAAFAGEEMNLKKRLLAIPAIAGVTFRADMIASFEGTLDETVLMFTFFSVALAGIIAFAVVYNNARIALAERTRELASLRVLGFSRGEVAAILNGEIGVLTLIAIPVGFIIGVGLCALMSYGMQTEIYRIPLVLMPSTFATAATVVLVATGLSMLIISQKLNHIDILSALKAVE